MTDKEKKKMEENINNMTSIQALNSLFGDFRELIDMLYHFDKELIEEIRKNGSYLMDLFNKRCDIIRKDLKELEKIREFKDWWNENGKI